jgi:hypothetical protein
LRQLNAHGCPASCAVDDPCSGRQQQQTTRCTGICLICHSVLLAGKYTWSNGAVYEGEYADNVKQGQGTMTFPDKSKYEGVCLPDCENMKQALQPAAQQLAQHHTVLHTNCVSITGKHADQHSMNTCYLLSQALHEVPLRQQQPLV